MENQALEVRANVKFLVNLGWQGIRIIEALQTVYGENTPVDSTIYRWISRFKEGREELKDDQRGGRPSTSISEANVEAVRILLEEDRRADVRELSGILGISVGSVDSILKEHLNLTKRSARWMPKALDENHKQKRVEFATDLLIRMDTDSENFFRRIVTGDEVWIYQYDPETKQQSKEWLPKGSRAPIKFKQERSGKKVMATVFWDSEGVILVDFLDEKKTITAQYYVEVLKKLRSALAKKRPGKLHARVLFHQYNAPAHSAKTTRDLLREFKWELLRLPPYSPDMAPSDYFLFPNLKNHIKGLRWGLDH